MKTLRNQNPKKDRPKGHGYFNLQMPKLGPVKRAWIRWRNSEVARRLGRKGRRLTNLLDQHTAWSNERYHTLAATTAAETTVRHHLYEDAKSRHDNVDTVIAERLRILDQWRDQQTARIDETRDAQMQVLAEQKAVIEDAAQATRKRHEDLAAQLGTPPGSGRIGIRKWWTLPALLAIAMADWKGLAASLAVLGTNQGTASAMALGFAGVLMFIAHKCGVLIRQQGAKGAGIAVALSLIPMATLVGLSVLRAQYMSATMHMAVDGVGIGTFAAMMLCSYLAGVGIGYSGSVRDVAATVGYNRTLREEKEHQAKREALQAQKAAVQKQHQQAIEHLRLRYTDRWGDITQELPVEIAEVYEDRLRNWAHLSTAMKHVRLIAEAQLQRQTARAKRSFELAGGTFPDEEHQQIARAKSKADRPVHLGNGRRAKTLAAALILAVASSGCEMVQQQPDTAPSTHLVVLHDRSGSFGTGKTMYNDAELLQLMQIDTTAPEVFRGCIFEGSVIDGAYISTTVHDELPAADHGQNIFLRRGRVREFITGFRYSNLLHVAPGLQDASDVVSPLGDALGTLARSTAERRIALVVSDMIHCVDGSLCLLDTDTYRDLTDDPHAVVEALEAIAPLPPTLDGIEVIILTDVQDSGQSVMMQHITRFWKNLLLDRGAKTVTVRRNLPQVWKQNL